MAFNFQNYLQLYIMPQQEYIYYVWEKFNTLIAIYNFIYIWIE